jgi:hypothetical protein
MPLSPEELLAPRYKVIADYPDSIFDVGFILNYDAMNLTAFWEDGNLFIDLDKYPNIFKPLEWYEDREIDEMPEYVKCIKTPNQVTMPGDVIKVDKWFDHTIAKSGQEMYVMSTNCYLPATNSEYTNYLNSKK